MPEFLYSNRDHKFIIKEWLDGNRIFELDRFKDSYNLEDVDMVLDQALKVAKEVVAPTLEDSEKNPCQLVDGKVIMPESYHHVYRFLNENGWGSSNINLEEEGVLPDLVLAACKEMMTAAGPGVVQIVGLTSGSSKLIQFFGDQRVKDLFLPKMFSGQWAGTMCLTEPGGGSDVGDLLSRAYPTDVPGVYQIRGTKCFISQGDHNVTENIVHLTLARIEGAAPGTRGVSLFAVPKNWVNDDGSMGEWNDVTTIAIEHKLGWKGSATAMLNFGDNGNCRGFLLGSPPDENGVGQGMAQMFQMVNGARMSTGLSAMTFSSSAYYSASQYARERIQGRKFSAGKDATRVRLIEHEDVRRMLMRQKSTIEAMRAMLYKTYYYFDIVAHSADGDERDKARRMIDVNTPLVKAYCSDISWELIADAIQVYGGYGYSEEYPVARCARDTKILSIWEGANFIQSLDLVGRKWSMKKGTVFAEWLADIDAFIEKNGNTPGFEREMGILADCLKAYKEARTFILTSFQEKPHLMPLYSTRLLHSTAMLYCGMLIIDQALVAKEKAAALSADHPDRVFYLGKVESAKFYVCNVVPEVIMLSNIIKTADTSALDIPEDAL